MKQDNIKLVCKNDHCSKRFQCFRWHKGTYKDPHNEYLVENATDGCEFFVSVN